MLLSLRWEAVLPLPHGLGLARIEHVFKLRQPARLDVVHGDHIGIWLLQQEDHKNFALEVNTAFVLRVDQEALGLLSPLNEENLKIRMILLWPSYCLLQLQRSCTHSTIGVQVNDLHKVLLYQINEVTYTVDLRELLLGNKKVEEYLLVLPAVFKVLRVGGWTWFGLFAGLRAMNLVVLVE